MKTDVVKPKEVFYNPTRLVVPLFQRPYVWSKETQWEPLWQDIVRLIDVISEHSSDATHFLGAIVIQQVPSALGGLPEWNIIDGQQRLTTLQLLLDALHSELLRREFPALAEQVQPLVENPPAYCESEEDRYKLWPTNRDRAGFITVMGAPVPVAYSTIAKTRMRDAHQYFASAIDEWLGLGDDAEKRAKMLVATVTDRLEIASIRLDTNEDAQAIFETLNARGTPLSAADLIKNFVFQNFEGDQSAAEAAYLKYWADFETPWWETEVTSGRVKHSRASLFLWQWLTARRLVDFPIREVFTQFKYHVNTVEKDIASMLPRLKDAADNYRAIIEGSEAPNGPLTRTQLFSYRVGLLDSEIARPLIIWLHEPEQAGIPSDDIDRVLEVLESWFVRRALVKVPSQGTNRFVIDLMKHLSGTTENLPMATQQYLAANNSRSGYWPGDVEVREALTGASAYWKYIRARLRMVLEALEDHKRGYPNGGQLALGPIVRGKATIEHLMPQAWQTSWPADLSEEEEAKRNATIQQLGNLTLITQALNSKVSNGPWAAKRSHLVSSDDVLITKDALAVDEWSESTIELRTESMISQILDIWPVPEGHIGVISEVKGTAPVPVSVDVAQLVSAGLISVGATLVAAPKVFEGAEASVARDGRIFVNGVGFESPTGAAAALNTAGNYTQGINGWVFWRLSDSGETLADVRETYLASLGDAEVEVSDEAAEAAPIAEVG